MIRTSDYIVQKLAEIGAGPAFLLSGGGMMHLIDAVAKADYPYVCFHHEQAAAMAADGSSRTTGRLGVVYATSGPGATNVLTGLVGAWQDSAPVLFLTGQSKLSQTIGRAPEPGLRQFGTFEVDIVGMVGGVTKFSHFLDDPADIRAVLEEAIYHAMSGRPGPVLIDIPLDVQGALVDPETLRRFLPPETAPPAPSPQSLEIVAEHWRAARRPLLLVGHGVRSGGAISELRNVVERLGVPVVATQLAKDALPYDSPYFVGHPGPKGDRAGNFALQTADFILSVGSSLHAQSVGYESDLFAPGAFKVQVDIERAILMRGDVPVDLQISADVGVFLAALADLYLPAAPADWVARCQTWKTRFAVDAEPHDRTTSEINFYEVANALSDGLAGDEVVVTDAGSAFYVMGQAFRLKGQQRYIVSGAMGAMGYALPAAIGAAATGSTAICVTGDGSLQTNIQELQTLVHTGLPVKLFIIDNDGYASIRNTQKGFFGGRLIGASRDSGVSTPSTQRIAEAYGLPYIGIDNRSDLTAGIERALATRGPVVVGIRAQSGQVIIPSVASRQLPGGGMRSNPLHIMNPPLADDVVAAELGDLLHPAEAVQ